MMKTILIDKMKLLDDAVKRSYSRSSLDLILNQPEVKAIPIEWIVKRINYYSDLILTYPNEKEILYSQTELISLLEEWEKENEIDRCR